MATLISISFGFLVISALVLGSSIQATAETLNFKVYTYVTKQEVIPIGDEEGHALIFGLRSGFYVFENGEVATTNIVVQAEQIKGTVSIMMYKTLTYTDGSTIIIKSQGTSGGGGPGSPASATFRGEIIKGTHSFKTKFIPPEKGEPGPKGFGEGTMNYTLPSK